MDKSCAQLPQQITHDFHPHHSLNLNCSLNHSRPRHAHSQLFSSASASLSPIVTSRCNACSNFMGRVLYNCSECEFSLDVRCASLIPKSPNAEAEPFTFTHPHVLIPCDCDSKAIFGFCCSACEMSIEDGRVYVCLQCRLFLHKSCAQLPPKIKHPFHPPHPLVLCDDYMGNTYSCQACKCPASGYRYWCDKCQFAIDVTCASLSYSTFNSELHPHPHPLAFFNHNKRNKPTQNKCICGRALGFPFFRCVPCNFTLNLCCHPTLPHTFKHSCHGRHSLTLTYSPIKDHPDDDERSEYYCDLCEERRALQEPTYYCEECHYVAHLRCIFVEVCTNFQRFDDTS